MHTRTEWTRISTQAALIVAAVFAVYKGSATEDTAPEWRYVGIHGLQYWPEEYQTCDIKIHPRQSPINIETSTTVPSTSLTRVGFVINPVPNDTVIIINNGHTVSFSYNSTAADLKGGLLDSFRMAGVHFHWGSANTNGSEHTINGARFPLEMHMVSYDRSRYNSLLNATSGNDSIAVLSVLFRLSDSDNVALNPIISRINNVQVAGNYTTFWVSNGSTFFNLSDLLPPDTDKYYRYPGSLTTPPCSDSVIWTVFDTLQNVSAKQLESFRILQETIEPNETAVEYMEDNWRPVQQLYGRIVLRSFMDLGDADSTTVKSVGLNSITTSTTSQLFSLLLGLWSCSLRYSFL